MFKPNPYNWGGGVKIRLINTTVITCLIQSAEMMRELPKQTKVYSHHLAVLVLVHRCNERYFKEPLHKSNAPSL